jgi:hypothetical protein
MERPSRGGAYYRQRCLCSTYQEESQQMSELNTFNQLIPGSCGTERRIKPIADHELYESERGREWF